MKIAYCTNVRLPSERAHGHQVARVTEALALLGHTVTIFAPFRLNPITENFAGYHHLKADVTLRTLGSFDPISSKLFPGVLGLWMLNWRMRTNLRTELHDFDLLYTRSPSLLPTFVRSTIPTVLELHSIPRRGTRFFVRLCNRCSLVVALTNVMASELKAIGVTAPIIVEGDAVDLELFANAVPVTGHSTNEPLIVYAGQLESMGLSKGIPELLGALALLEEQKFPFRAVIAGGPEASRTRFVASMSPSLQSRVTFTGLLPHSSIPALLKAASVLVYPAPASDHPFYRRDTSPLKLFEYAASGRPIVAADLPPLRDVFDDSSVTFVRPGDAVSLAQGIGEALKHPEKATKAFQATAKHTWTNRMQRIVAEIPVAA
ncbi:MAG: glycosyltransferase family 4 protein [Candidatus Peribacteraceae bacterium]